MNFAPKSDKEIEEAGLIPHGTICNAEVNDAAMHTSKSSGKESIKVILRVYHEELVRDIAVYLTPAYARLFKHAVCAMVSQEAYERGDISPEEFQGKCCQVKISISEEEYNGQTRRKNVVADIMPPLKSDEKGDFPF